jgi:hypothetical protein
MTCCLASRVVLDNRRITHDPDASPARGGRPRNPRIARAPKLRRAVATVQARPRNTQDRRKGRSAHTQLPTSLDKGCESVFKHRHRKHEGPQLILGGQAG